MKRSTSLMVPDKVLLEQVTGYKIQEIYTIFSKICHSCYTLNFTSASLLTDMFCVNSTISNCKYFNIFEPIRSKVKFIDPNYLSASVRFMSVMPEVTHIHSCKASMNIKNRQC